MASLINRSIVFCFALTFGVACANGNGASGGGTVIIASAAEPDVLFPPLVRNAAGRIVTEQIFERLADLRTGGDPAVSADFTPRIARDWRWSNDSLGITFEINPAARWHDGKPIRARDVAFALSVYKDAKVYDRAAALASIDSMIELDSLTIAFRFSRRDSEQLFNLTSQLFILPEHLLGKLSRDQLVMGMHIRNPVGSGPFRFRRWEAGKSIELAADSGNYNGRPSIDRLVFAITPDYRAAAARVIAGDADFTDAADPKAPVDAASSTMARTIALPARQFTFIAFNFRERRNAATPHPILGDRAVRTAIALAVNRAAAVSLALDTTARIAHGPFVRSMAVADTTLRQIPFDPVRATRLLDSTGWRVTGDREFREKGGRRLEFRLLTPRGNNLRRQTALIAQADLRKIGVSMVVDSQSYPVFSSRLAAHDFDAFFGASLATPGSRGIDQIWSGRPGDPPGFLNHGSYASPTFVALADSLNFEFNPARRKRLTGRVFQQITDEVAAIWMYESSEIGLINTRIRIPSPPAFNWWTEIRNWSIDPARRIARDQGGSGY